MTDWNFYGRSKELEDIENILKRKQFFFCQISGRRRIGKTALLEHILRKHERRFYMQVPDSDAHGVVSAFEDALNIHGAPQNIARVASDNFANMANYLSAFWSDEWVTVLDEFQYFHRKELSAFPSHLQARIDEARLSGQKPKQPQGGLFALGSIHTEMMAILEDRDAPLFNRVTDRIELQHWDFETLFEMFRAHEIEDSYHRLFLWSLFEGVPKFYRDCYDQNILERAEQAPHDLFIQSPSYRSETLRAVFFEGSAPLREEAENWFLRELHGKYDTILKLIAKHRACDYARLHNEYTDKHANKVMQFSSYLQVLTSHYQMVEKHHPFGASPNSRKTRYVISDNFLSSWLSSVARYVKAARFQQIDKLIPQADEALKIHEGHMFEKFCRQALEECGRKGVGRVVPTRAILSWWHRQGKAEIDLIAVNEYEKIIHFGSCKRNAKEHKGSLKSLETAAQLFLQSPEARPYKDWSCEFGLYSPEFPADVRTDFTNSGYYCTDMSDIEDWLLCKGNNRGE